jgi:hypothetical protein
MAEGRPDWGTAIRAAAQARPGAPVPVRQPELSSRKVASKSGHHTHNDDDASMDGSHHHQDLVAQLKDHHVRLNAIEAHFKGTSPEHEGHMSDD